VHLAAALSQNDGEFFAVFLVAEPDLHSGPPEDVKRREPVPHLGLHFLSYLERAFRERSFLESEKRGAARDSNPQQAATRTHLRIGEIENVVVFEMTFGNSYRVQTPEICAKEFEVCDWKLYFSFDRHRSSDSSRLRVGLGRAFTTKTRRIARFSWERTLPACSRFRRITEHARCVRSQVGIVPLMGRTPRRFPRPLAPFTCEGTLQIFDKVLRSLQA